MATITPTIAPGAYLEHQTVRFNFSADITQVAVTAGNVPPSISKYIAYDTLTPANPFLAVTEDGRGRVVYDGGFPKFYNGAANGATSFATLNGSCKFLYNAIHWVKNSEKWASGNRKVLILGDVESGINANFDIKGTANYGFYNTFTTVCSIAGVTPTFKTRNEYANSILDARLSELEQYVAVIVLSSYHGPDGAAVVITPQSVSDFVTYRENGNGVILITDHGVNYNNITEASSGQGTGFFMTANQIAVRFGAYFTGDFNRTPVNVGFLRANYGNHPLYNGLADSEEIIAGGSESKVVVQQTTTYAPGAVPAFTTNINGLNTYNVLAMTTSGEMITGRYVYIVAGEEFLFVRVLNPETGTRDLNPTIMRTDLSGFADIHTTVEGASLGTIWGELLKNGKRIGEFGFKDNNQYLYVYAGGGGRTRHLNGETFEYAVRAPFGYSKLMTTVRKQPKTEVISKAAWAGHLRSSWAPGAITGVQKKAFDASRAVNALLAPNTSISPVSMRRRLVDIALQNFDAGEFTANIFATTAETQAAYSAAPVDNSRCFIDASTGNVYAYLTGTYKLISGLTPKDVYPTPCTLRNGSKAWKLSKAGALTPV